VRFGWGGDGVPAGDGCWTTLGLKTVAASMVFERFFLFDTKYAIEAAANTKASPNATSSQEPVHDPRIVSGAGGTGGGGCSRSCIVAWKSSECPAPPPALAVIFNM